jgi:hypothetical protein
MSSAAALASVLLLVPQLVLAQNSTDAAAPAVGKAINVPLAVESTFGAVLLSIAIFFQICFAFVKFDVGVIGRLQNYCTWCAGFAVCGHLTNAYGTPLFCSPLGHCQCSVDALSVVARARIGCCQSHYNR